MGEWLEEDLIWRGDAPPEGAWASNDWIQVPYEHYIPTPKTRLVELLLDRPEVADQRQAFSDFLELIDALFHFRYLRTLNELKADYQLFSPDGGAEARRGLSPDDLKERQQRFLANFLTTMVRANFLPFTAADSHRSDEHFYLLDAPVSVRWDRHDPRLLREFLNWADSEQGQPLRKDLGLPRTVEDLLSPAPAMADHALLFFRGIGRDQSTGRFLEEKVDVLVERILLLVLSPLLAVIRAARATPEPTAAPAAPATSIFTPRWVRRSNLRNQSLLPSPGRSLLQEPTLRQMVALFRLHPKQRGGVISEVKDLIAPASDQAESEDVDWTIYLKVFRAIPLADYELVFPEKRIHMKSLDVATLLATVVLALVALVEALLHHGRLATAVAVAAGVWVAKIIGQYMRARAKYIARMTESLYNKNLDNSVGVLQYLVDSLEEQEFKEAVLVYFLLWREDQPLTEPELDAAVERFLAEMLDGFEVDFEVDDALAKVVETDETDRDWVLPIVTAEEVEGVVRYAAKPLPDALRILDTKWDGLYTFSEETDSAAASA